jgi:putative intracellular protease/amidase
MTKRLIITSIALVLVLSGCGKTTVVKQAPVVELPKKVAVVFAPFEFNETDLNLTTRFLDRDKKQYDLVSIQSGSFKGQSGADYQVNKTAGDLKIDDYSSLVVVGGSGMAAIAGDDTLSLLVAKFGQSGKQVAGIGEGNLVLKSAQSKGAATSTESFLPELNATSSEEAISKIINSLN